MEYVLSPVSTSQAAEILGVHESSIKRWCRSKKLTCSYTSGGHRRFELLHLLSFAREAHLSSPLLTLHPYEIAIWNAVARARASADYAPLIQFVYEHLHNHEPVLLQKLLPPLLDMGLPLLELLDNVLAPVLHRVGQAWDHGDLEVGDEHRMTQQIKDALSFLRTHLLTSPRDFNNHVAVVGCIRTEEHELGALMTRLVLESLGWEVVYLGTNIPAEDFAHQQQKLKARLVCVSLSRLRSPADALALVRLLATLYQEKQPYRLALGGPFSMIPSEPSAFPFEDLQAFKSLNTFSNWV